MNTQSQQDKGIKSVVEHPQNHPAPKAARAATKEWNESQQDMDEALAREARWSLVPRALHFNIMCGDKVLYEGVTSESQGVILCDYHNASILATITKALAAEREKSYNKGRLDSQKAYELAMRDNRKLYAEIQQLDAELENIRKLVNECTSSTARFKKLRDYLSKLGPLTEVKP